MTGRTTVPGMMKGRCGVSCAIDEFAECARRPALVAAMERSGVARGGDGRKDGDLILQVTVERGEERETAGRC